MSDSSRLPTNATQLDPENPWPGLDSFEENSRDYFHGRVAEAEELLRRVVDAPLTVLFGKSGLGKTSLLKAGLFPRLRDKHFLPVHLRLDIRLDAPSLIEQLRHALRAAIEVDRVDAPSFTEGETLWEYLHRLELEFWSRQNYPLIPVLVLDQFEEVFTLGERLPGKVEQFQVDFGDLAENRIPMALATRLATDAATARRLDLRAMPYKLIVTLREDFLPHLEGWRRAVPSLGRVRVRLLPMRRDQALSVVYETAPHLMHVALAQRIVEFVAAAQTAGTAAHGDGASLQPSNGGGPAGEIEPALLSLFCRGLNERRKRQGKDRFDEQLLEGAQESIIADYFHSCVEGLPDGVSRFIETELVTGKGFRNSYAKDDAVPQYLTQEQLDRLINRRLLRLEERYGTVRIELTHDLLTRAVMDQRDRRRIEEEKAALARHAEEERQNLEAQTRKQRQRFRAMALVALTCLALAGIAGWQWWQAVVAKGEALRAKKLADDKTIEANTEQLAAEDAKGEAIKQAGRAEAREKEALEARHEEQAARVLATVKSPGREFEALALAIQLAGPNRSGGLPMAAIASLAAAVTAAQRSFPLRGHGGEVISAAFSPNGRSILTQTTGSQPMARLWETATGRLLASVPQRIVGIAHNPVSPSAFSPDGRQVIVSAADATAHILDARDGRVIRKIRPSSPKKFNVSSVSDAGFSPVDNSLVMVAGFSDGIGFWDGKTGKIVAPIDLMGWTHTAFSADGTRLLTGGQINRVRVWTVPSGERIRDLPQFSRTVGGAFSPDGTRAVIVMERGRAILVDTSDWNRIETPANSQPTVISSSAFSPNSDRLVLPQESKVILLDAKSGKLLGEFDGHTDTVESAEFSKDGKFVVTASKDGTARIWNVEERTVRETLQGHRYPLRSAIVSRDGRYIATTSTDWTARLWDTRNDRSRQTMGSGRTPVLSARFSPDDRRVLLIFGNKPELWDSHSGKRLTVLEGHLKDISAGMFSPDGRRILTVSESENKAILRDGKTGTLVSELGGTEDSRVTSAVFIAGGDRIITGGPTWITWDGITGTRTKVWTGPEKTVKPCIFSNDGSRAVTFDNDNNISVWDTLAGKRVVNHKLDVAKRIISACFAPDGSRVLTISEFDPRSGQLWDARTGRLLGALQGHLDDITSFAYSLDGKLIVTASKDQTAGLWDADTRKRIFTLEGHNATVEDAIFSPDNTRILTRGADRAARVWDVQTGHLLATLQGHAEALTSAEFSHDSNYVLTASKDGTAKKYEVRLPVLAEEYFAAACRLLRYQPEFEQEKVKQYCEPSTKPAQPKK